MGPSTRALATGIGSLPGLDPTRANSLVSEIFPDLPFLVELPDRGVGADFVGRACLQLAELHFDLQPSGWRLVDRAGSDERRARSLLSRDLDAFQEALSGYEGPIKTQVTGALTLAALLNTSRGGSVLADQGACKDVTQSLVEGMRSHVAELRKRIPGATKVYLQIDEPMLPKVAAGDVSSASGLSRIRKPSRSEIVDTIGAFSGLADELVLHCCAAGVDLEVLRDASVKTVSIDYKDFAISDVWGRWLEGGSGVWFGVVSGVDAPLPNASATVSDMRQRLSSLGFDLAKLAPRIGVTASCGYAGASENYVRESAKRLAEMVESIGELS
jgi:methionine synthase II (cobalamin-independent)